MENTKLRFVTVEVKGKPIKYLEKYVVDENGEEIFNRDIEIENDIRLYDEYKLKTGLLTSSQIKRIRSKYGLTQKEYALVLGMGEISIHRFEKGSIPTDTIDNVIRLSANPINLKEMLKRQMFDIPEELYSKVSDRINELLCLKEHALIDMDNIERDSGVIFPYSATDIAKKIIDKYYEYINKNTNIYGTDVEYITNEKLQNLLYYVQACCLYLYDKKAFKEKIYATSKGAMIEGIEEINNNYVCEENEEYGKESFKSNIDEIIEQVIENYGKIETNKLIEHFCNEDPFVKTKQGEEIKIKHIKEYFNKIYSI